MTTQPPNFAKRWTRDQEDGGSPGRRLTDLSPMDPVSEKTARNLESRWDINVPAVAMQPSDVVVIPKSVTHRLLVAAQVQGCYDSEILRPFLGCRCKSKHNLCASAEMSICEGNGVHTGTVL